MEIFDVQERLAQGLVVAVLGQAELSGAGVVGFTQPRYVQLVVPVFRLVLVLQMAVLVKLMS